MARVGALAALGGGANRRWELAVYVRSEARERTRDISCVNVHLYSSKLYWKIHFCGKGGAPSYFCGLSVYGDLYVERSRRVPWSRGRHCDEYLADHPEEQVQEHQVLWVRV